MLKFLCKSFFIQIENLGSLYPRSRTLFEVFKCFLSILLKLDKVLYWMSDSNSQMMW